jgi:hypothetical protein
MPATAELARAVRRQRDMHHRKALAATILLLSLLAACSSGGDPLPAPSGVRGVVVAGPTCPVVTDPPDPSCTDRPVEGAVILVLARDGSQVARATSAADGTFTVALAPGAYRLVPQPVDGLMGTAQEQDLGVAADGPMAEVTIAYDTGIR